MTSWKTDTKRDMLTYRFIELTASLIESILADNEDDLKKYNEWLRYLSGNNPDAIKLNEKKPTIISEINPTKDSLIKVIALPSDNNFVAEFKTPVFTAYVNMIYDFDRYDITLATIEDFEGDLIMAISWAEDMMGKIDEMRIKA